MRVDLDFDLDEARARFAALVAPERGRVARRVQHEVDVEGLAYLVVLIIERLDREHPWRKDASCRGHPDAFFPASGQSAGPACAVCARCPVRVECSEYAAGLDGQLVGVWAGVAHGAPSVRRSGTRSEPKPSRARDHCTDCAGVLPRGRVGACWPCEEAKSA